MKKSPAAIRVDNVHDITLRVHFFTPVLSDKRNSVHSGTAALASRYIVDSAEKLNSTVSSEAESGN